MMKLKQYAVYKGEDLLAMGTAAECGKQLGVATQTIYGFATRGRENKNEDNRTIAVEMEDDAE